jgi:hypothetical protein
VGARIGDEGGGGGGPPPSGGDGGLRRRFGGRGTEEYLPGNRAGVQRGERVDAEDERFVSLARRFEPVAHGMAAYEARADLLAG